MGFEPCGPSRYSKGDQEFQVIGRQERKGHSEGDLFECSDGLYRTQKYLISLEQVEGWYCPDKRDHFNDLYNILNT